ncbi:MAG: hypothetical protein ACOCV8_02960, partial [Spirochaetota bacterium]
RIIRSKDGRISIYQIVSTSHIIIHFNRDVVNADLFSCEPFDVDKSVKVLTDKLGDNAIIQYCQRNLLKEPPEVSSIPMVEMNRLTSNPKTFTHALINWYGGNERLLGDIEHGTHILNYALQYLNEDEEGLPPSNVLLVDVEPIPSSWDLGGFSGGYINLSRQLTMHTFAGINGAYTDIMGYTFNLEKIIKIIKEGFKFKFYEVDGIFQRLIAF